ncbi:MEI1 protein, partial [Trifolium medium]|nr:MEI1 protein [Trifolium medium]
MLVDYAASRKLYEKRIQNEIDELKRRMKDLQIEYSKIGVDLKSKLGPLYKAMEAFSEIVKERYFVKYLNDPARKEN